MNSDVFNGLIDDLWAQTKAGKLPRAERFIAVERMTEVYIEATGRRPEPAQLDRLATLCLYEEVTDPNEHKMTHQERPILSARQEERRHDGEVSFTFAEEVGTDGRDYRAQTRLNRRKLKKL